MMLGVVRCLLVAVGLVAMPAMSADLPKATQKFLAELNLDPSIMTQLDEELAVPQAWIDGAREEGALRMSATWDPAQYRQLNSAFVERYPFIKHQYARGTKESRTLKALMAFESGGRVTTDLIGSIGSGYVMLKEANALVDMRDLPGWKNVPDGMKGSDGLWVGQELRYWCITYNTDKVKKEDLPKTWDDLLTNLVWRDGNLALSNRPNLWFTNLWARDGYGASWGAPYLRKLFGDVKPQRRKEGNNALSGMVIAGEFHAVIPGAASRTFQYAKKGAPISWHCPEPVPLAISGLGIIKGNPHPNAAKLWANWFLSKEGQIAQFHAEHSPPVHKDLQTEAFLSFPEQILGKNIAFRDPIRLEKDLAEIFEIWNPLWDPSGRTTRSSREEED